MVNSHVNGEGMLHLFAPACHNALYLKLYYRVIDFTYRTLINKPSDLTRIVLIAFLLCHHKHTLPLFGKAN